LFAVLESLPWNVTIAAAFALLALGVASTVTVQLWPGSSVPTRHWKMAALEMFFDCVHVPPDESVIDWMVMLVGRCCRNTTPLAVVDPRFFTCHVIVPFVAPSA
jgi:hypothetical protein